MSSSRVASLPTHARVAEITLVIVVLVRRSHAERAVRRTARTTARRKRRLPLARMRQVNPTRANSTPRVLSLDGYATKKTTISTWNVGKVRHAAHVTSFDCFSLAFD